jgi:hypothetical protein
VTCHEDLRLFLGPPPGQVQLVDHVDKATRQLRVELVVWLEADAELEALWDSVVRVWDLVLDNADGTSSLIASISTAVELLEGRVDDAAANGFC